MKVQFPLIGGLHNTLLLHKTLLNLQDYNHSLQIIFITDRAHWALLQVVRNDVFLYDSMFVSPSNETKKVLLTNSSKTKHFDIMIMNIQR